MKKKGYLFAAMGMLAILLMSATTAYAMPNEGKGGGNSTSKGKGSSGTGISGTGVTSTLTDTEIADLVFMREEEKLARDVYLTLYNTWGLDIFNNIAASEQAHTDTIKGLLDSYGIADPVVNDTVGVFTNPELQALYNQLVATGNTSLTDALKVGAAIEEIDIIDLYEAMERTAQPNILQVYSRLLAGSENHLRGFVSTLNAQGVDYAPQYLDAATYSAIISGASGSQQGGSTQNQSSGGRRGKR